MRVYDLSGWLRRCGLAAAAVLMMTWAGSAGAGTTYGLAVGQKAPDFTAKTYDGKTVNLKSLTDRGTVALIFYRGAWCPFCNLHLQAFQRKLADFENAGITVLAVSVDRPEESAKTVQKNKLGFAVVSDASEALLRDFNVFGTARHAGMTVAVPATYLIDRTGVIRYAFVNENPMVRSKPDKVLEAAREIRG